MISVNFRNGLNEALRLIAYKLDLDETRYNNAEAKYKAVANWLSADDSSLNEYDPDIYPQGSFMLGTVVKPKASDEYDLDFVCQLDGFDGEPKEIKKILGDRLKENERYHSPVLEEKNRCWRLNYAGEFHMDILPGRPNYQAGLSNTAIEVPDKKLNKWKSSDPRAYGLWFKERMKEDFERKRRLVASTKEMSIEKVPEYSVKTTLQQAIQLLKRNRNIVFANDEKNSPISMIITTLAGQSYQNEYDLFEALRNSITKMPGFIQEINGVSWVQNPVNVTENFAEKWEERPQIKDKFFDWLTGLNNSLSRFDLYNNVEEAQTILSELFGERLTYEVIHEMKESDFFRQQSQYSPPNISVPKQKPWGE